MPQSFDTLPTLDMRQLRKAGLFRSFGISIEVVHKAKSRVTYNHNLKLATIEITDEDEYNVFNVRCSFVSNNLGGRGYFECPQTGKRTERLYYFRGELHSRAALSFLSKRNGSPAQRDLVRSSRLINRLHGRDGAGPARGLNRRKILRELGADPLTMTHYPEIREEVEKVKGAEVREILRQESGLKYGPSSTRSCLKAFWEPDFDLLAHGIPELAKEPSSALVQYDPASLWLAPAVDLPTYLRKMAENQAEVLRFSMVWPMAEIHICADVAVDIRYRYDAGIRIHVLDCGYPAALVARIVRSPNGRRRLVCPISGKLYDTLYLRGGQLGSRDALNLSYPNYSKGEKLRTDHMAKFLHEVAAEAKAQVAAEENRREQEREEILIELAVREARIRKALSGDVPSMISYLEESPDWQESSSRFTYPEVAKVSKPWKGED